jgi:hypothetical protein
MIAPKFVVGTMGPDCVGAGVDVAATGTCDGVGGNVLFD